VIKFVQMTVPKTAGAMTDQAAQFAAVFVETVFARIMKAQAGAQTVV
jgi:hypothetical protein